MALHARHFPRYPRVATAVAVYVHRPHVAQLHDRDRQHKQTTTTNCTIPRGKKVTVLSRIRCYRVVGSYSRVHNSPAITSLHRNVDLPTDIYRLTETPAHLTTIEGITNQTDSLPCILTTTHSSLRPWYAMDRVETQPSQDLYSAVHPRPIQCDAPRIMAPEAAYVALSIDQVAHEFVENVKVRFGELSSQVYTINKALCNFWTTRVSKRDAISTILLALGDQEDLRRHLLNVLYHRDAQWGIGDFDLGQTTAQSIPQFLQPVHQPQLRLPPISPSWSTDHPSTQTINQTILSDYSGPHMFGRQYRQDSHYEQYGDRMWPPYSHYSSSPISQGYFCSSYSNHLRLPAPDFTSRTRLHVRPFPESINEISQHNVCSTTQSAEMSHTGLNPTHYQESTIGFHESQFEHGHNHRMMNGRASTNQSSQMFQPGHGFGSSRALTPNSSKPNHTLIKTPKAVPVDQAIVTGPVPSKMHGRGASIIDAFLDGHQPDNSAGSPETRNSAGIAQAPPRKHVDTKAPRWRAEESYRFIHSLCGKAFSSRYGVKKHHWGAKNEDIHTTTGCWAKHKKPKVSWDAHATCREQPVVLSTSRKTGSMAPKQGPDHMLPSLLTGSATHGVISGFPTLQGLPQTVAEAVTPRVANKSSWEGIGSNLAKQLRIQTDLGTSIIRSDDDRLVSRPNVQGVIAPRYGHHTPDWLNGISVYQRDRVLDGDGPDVDAMAMTNPSSPSRVNGSEYGTPFSPNSA